MSGWAVNPWLVWDSRKGVGAWIKAGETIERLARMKEILKRYDKNLLPFSFLENSQRDRKQDQDSEWHVWATALSLSACAVNCVKKQGVGQWYPFHLICHCYRERSSRGEDELHWEYVLPLLYKNRVTAPKS